ncbi:T9SS type A sorting domain-containing protein [Flavobacteriaceae bacterium]|nr:T9SS type A sorting domain-containing protein [Flavobacteriaceae bacterium]
MKHICTLIYFFCILSCGTTTIYRTITPPPAAPCNNNYRIETKRRDTFRIIADPCISSKTRSNFTLNSKQTQNVEVFNHYGRLVYTTRQREFDLSFLRKGIYIIKAHVNREIITHKFIKK